MQDESTVIPVSGVRPYEVVVGRDLLGRLPDALGQRVRKVLIVHPGALGARAAQLREALIAASGLEVLLAEVPDAEGAKRIEVASFLWEILGKSDFTRSDAIIGLGGGATTDLAGFVAATWLRGVAVVHLPTTLLGMVDASVGGKTGLNTTEGKNLIGAFHPPAGVLCDLGVLETLPRNEFVAGLAEVAKCGFIADPAILDLLADGAPEWDSPVTRELIERSIRVKADVVADDLLVHFDDARALAALRLLTTLGRTAQVVLFTHHDHIATLAASLGSPEVAVIRFGEGAVVPAAQAA